MEIKKEPFSTTCEDGTLLKGVLFIPNKPKAVVQFNGGTGAKKEYYQPFLEYLCGHGYICCLWDYRGNGESLEGSLKNQDYFFRDYGIQDMPAIKKYLTDKFPQLPFFFVVHSVGGQQIGFIQNLSDVKGMVAFAVSTGYLKNMPIVYKLLSYYFFYLFTPVSNLLAGYVKAKPFGYMENLPKSVALEWREWCAKPYYFFDPSFYGNTVPKGQFEDLPFPIHMFSVSDDDISQPKNIDNYWRHVKSRKGITFTQYDPSDLNSKKVGHMGFFRRKFRENAWKNALDKLESFFEESKA